MKQNNTPMPVEYQIDEIQAKGKRALFKLCITVPFAIGGFLTVLIISILDDDVFAIGCIMVLLPLLINVLYVFSCYLKAKKLEKSQQ